MAFLLSRKGAALVVALFSLSAVADEYADYLELKSALVRSSARRDRLLPDWLTAPQPKHFVSAPESVPFVPSVDNSRRRKTEVLCPVVQDGRVVGGRSCDY